MGDPITATMIIGTLAGAGISAGGAIQGGQARAAAARYQAGVGAALGGAEMQAADVTEYAGGRASQFKGGEYAGFISKGAVGYGAGNVAGRTVSDVRASQTALGVQAQRETFGRYANTALQERLHGTELIAGGRLQEMAAAQAPIAGAFEAGGDVATGFGKAAGMYASARQYDPSVVGDSQPVATKWYGDNQPLQTYPEYYNR